MSETKNILLMDDEEILRTVASHMLRSLGLTPVCAKNGAEAISLWQDAESKNQPFYAAILDLTVSGGMGGEEAAKKIRQFSPTAYLIATSGSPEEGPMFNPTSHFFDSALAKPFDMVRLAAVLQRKTNS